MMGLRTTFHLWPLHAKLDLTAVPSRMDAITADQEDKVRNEHGRQRARALTLVAPDQCALSTLTLNPLPS